MWSEIIPMSFILPKEKEELEQFASGFQHDKQMLWIVKPPNANSGHGIQVVDDVSQLALKEEAIVQKYVSNPYLIKGHKFDLRLYVLITSLDPLVVYLYGDGLVRFATEPYTTSQDQLGNNFIHLTNFAINKVWLDPN